MHPVDPNAFSWAQPLVIVVEEPTSAAYRTVLSNPLIPTVSAARESPAISPPPMSEVVLISAGTSPSAGLVGFFVANRSNSPLITPPAANQMVVGSSTNPPKEEAYGLGKITASNTKSLTCPDALPLANFW